jgi:hypothetical protein
MRYLLVVHGQAVESEAERTVGMQKMADWYSASALLWSTPGVRSRVRPGRWQTAASMWAHRVRCRPGT